MYLEKNSPVPKFLSHLHARHYESTNRLIEINASSVRAVNTEDGNSSTAECGDPRADVRSRGAFHRNKPGQ